MLRRVLGIVILDKVSNETLYTHCDIIPASIQVISARWRLLGHTVRMDEMTPARKAMLYYYSGDSSGRKGNRKTIASVISTEFKDAIGTEIRTKEQYEELVLIAQDRTRWKELVEKIVAKQEEKRIVKREKIYNTRQNRKALDDLDMLNEDAYAQCV